MSELIDNIFEYKAYRYVPSELRLEWKTLYNLYKGKFYSKYHKIYDIYLEKRIDLYNEEFNRLKRIEYLCLKFNKLFENLQPKYNTDIKYSKEIKKSLKKSIDKLLLFISNKILIIEDIMENKKVSKKNTFEHFNDEYEDQLTNSKLTIIITLILIFIIFYVLIQYNE